MHNLRTGSDLNAPVHLLLQNLFKCTCETAKTIEELKLMLSEVLKLLFKSGGSDPLEFKFAYFGFLLIADNLKCFIPPGLIISNSKPELKRRKWQRQYWWQQIQCWVNIVDAFFLRLWRFKTPAKRRCTFGAMQGSVFRYFPEVLARLTFKIFVAFSRKFEQG